MNLFLLFLAFFCQVIWTANTAATNPPKFISKGGHINVKEGTDLELECIVDDLGEFVILWKFNKTNVLFTGDLRIHRIERISTNENGALIFKDVMAEYSGSYTCQVSTNPPKEIIYEVKVLSPPHVYVDRSYIEVRKSEPINLKCVSNGETIEWKKDNQVLGHNNSLTIDSAKPDDSGIYECIASNENGQSSDSVSVRVLFAPELETGSPVINAHIGQSIQIKCVVNSDPPANIIWFGVNNKKLVSTDNLIVDRINRTTLSYLIIVNVTENNYGNYSCVANNHQGSAVQVIKVTGKPSIPIISSLPLSGNGSRYTN